MLKLCPYSEETQFSSQTLRDPHGPGLRTITPVRAMAVVAVLRPDYVFFHILSQGRVYSLFGLKWGRNL